MTIANIDIYKEFDSRHRAENSLHEFVRQAWPTVEGETPFVDGWVIGAICEHLEAVVRGEITTLIVNMPPRCCKSTIISVMFLPWVWIKLPYLAFLYATHSSSLVRRDATNSRRVIQSDWYQLRWGDRFQILRDENTKSRYMNDKSGYRLSISVNSGITGDGGDIQIADDANDIKATGSDVKRQTVNEWWDRSFSTRANDPKRRARIVTAQRSHELDLSGHLLQKYKDNDDGKTVHLMLPMEFVKSRQCKTIYLPSNKKRIWQDPRIKEGELLWPGRYGPKEVAEGKLELGSEYAIAGQYQQLPSPAEGQIILKKWWKPWKKEKPPENLIKVIQSWDTAMKAGEENCYSACTTWGLFKNDDGIASLILLSLWRGRVEFPELYAMAKRLYWDYRDDGEVDIKPDTKHVPDVVLVEEQASGISLLQEFRKAGIPAHAFKPKEYGDKMERVRIASIYIECGRIYLPMKPPDYIKYRALSELVVELCAIFPNADSRDVVDTITQVILWTSSAGLLKHREHKVIDKATHKPPQHEYYW